MEILDAQTLSKKSIKTDITRDITYEDNLKLDEEEQDKEPRVELAGDGEQHKEEFNPKKCYENLETSFTLSRLEEPSLLTAALRVVVRNMHHNGKV